MATVRDLIDSSLREIGVLAEGESASASQAWEGIQRLNRFIERLSLDRLTIFQIVRTTFTITSGDGTYLIGAVVGYKSPPQGGDVQIYRPSALDDVRFIDTSISPEQEYPLRKLTEEAYAALTIKDQTDVFPQAWYYSSTYPNGTLILWPAPTSATLEGVVYVATPITGFGFGNVTAAQAATILSTVLSVPDGYEEMLFSNLAVLLCPVYERQPHPVTAKTAVDSLAAIKRSNVRASDMSFDPAVLMGSGSHYDIRSG